MESLTVDPLRPEDLVLARAAAILGGGGLIAFPTETFYGLGADPRNEHALRRLHDLKGRPRGAPILLLLAAFDQIASVADRIPPSCERLASAFWPGPLTLVLPARPDLSALITADTATVGVRAPGLALPRALARALDRPLTGTSANRSGEPPAATAAAVRDLFAEDLDLLLDGGPTPGLAPSTVVDLTNDRPRLVRAGVIPFERVLAVIED